MRLSASQSPPLAEPSLISLPGGLCRDAQEPGCYSKIVLDEIAQVVSEVNFDNDVWLRMVGCLKQKSTDALPLAEVSDNAWKGFVEFGISGGSSTDVWGATPNAFIEKNPTPLSGTPQISDLDDVIIMEPCNTASNAALYRAAFAVCETDAWTFSDETVTAFVRSFNFLAFGSYFFHGSNTEVGSKADFLGMDTISFVGHQGALAPLPYDPILFDLRPTPRPLSGIQIAEESTRILLEENVSEWLHLFNGFDIPELEVSFGALVATGLNLFLDEETTVYLGSLLAGLLMGEGTPAEDFLVNVYMPVLLQAYADNSVSASLITKTEMALRMAGTSLKLVYAFLWQEDVIPSELLQDPTMNRVGAALIPVVNEIANTLTGYDRSSDSVFQASINVYPGDGACNRRGGHAKWHEVSANGLVDFFLAANDAEKVIRGERLLPRRFSGCRTGPSEVCNERMTEEEYFDNLRQSLGSNLEKGDCVDYLLGEGGEDFYGFLVCLETPLYGCATGCIETFDTLALKRKCALECYMALAAN